MKSLKYCDFVWENDELLVVNKHAGVLSVPGRLGVKDPRPCLSQYLRQELDASLMPVHRLDFEVSGLLILAKGPLAHRKLNQAFEQRQLQKTYYAISSLPEETDENLRLALSRGHDWTSLLVKGKKRTFIAPHGKTARTHGRLVQYSQAGSWALWRLSPLTGYTHQLRVELSHRFNPILGDTRYGWSGSSENKDFIALISAGIATKQETKGDQQAWNFQLTPAMIEAWLQHCQSAFALADFPLNKLVAKLAESTELTEPRRQDP